MYCFVFIIFHYYDDLNFNLYFCLVLVKLKVFSFKLVLYQIFGKWNVHVKLNNWMMWSNLIKWRSYIDQTGAFFYTSCLEAMVRSEKQSVTFLSQIFIQCLTEIISFLFPMRLVFRPYCDRDYVAYKHSLTVGYTLFSLMEQW